MNTHKLHVFVLAILALFTLAAFTKSQIQQDSKCPNSPATLKAGDSALVTVPLDDPLNSRVRPGLNQKIIIKIPAYTYITIIGEPICNGGYRWYEVQWDGKDGWSAEVGPDGIYNMILNSYIQSQTSATPSTMSEYWPDLLTGIWTGKVSCQVTFRPAETCNISLEIKKGADDHLILIKDTDNGQVNGVQANYKTLNDNQYYYCFSLYSADGYEIGESCFHPLDTNNLGFDEGNLAGGERGILKRVGNFTESPAPTEIATEIQPTQTETVPTPLPLPPDGPSSDPDPWCSLPGFCVQAAVNTTCTPQCVKTARDNRVDLILWGGSGTSDQILEIAQTQPQFMYNGQLQQVRVRDQGEQPQTGDLVIWPSGCGGAWSRVDKNGKRLSGGHIGYVTNGNPFKISDSNWGSPISSTQCAVRTNQPISILPCMRFITSPYPVASSIAPTPAADHCSQYKGLRWIWCKITGN